MSFLELSKVEKTYPNGTRAVKGVDLAIDEGQFVVLLGPSGCGKTTTLRMIAGLELATGGTIRLAGRDVTHLRPSERDVGFVFQFYALYPHLTVAENIGFPLEASGMPRAERQAMVRDVAHELGLDALLARMPRELSGGDQQRVSLARAMVRKPAAWLMDEPLGTLDSDRRLEMCEFVRARQLASRVTTVYVTHDQEEALRLADRIVVMADGVILQDAPPLEVYDEPATLFVAKFVGSPGMNFVEGEVREHPEGPRFHPRATSGGTELTLAVSRTARSGPTILGVRAEFVRAARPTATAHGAWRGRVIVDEYLGSSRSLHVDTPLGRIVARGDANAPSALGEEVALEFDGAHVRLFDPTSGRRSA
ncbi:MAG: ABC transporter ATP-binding protein [Planctomycetes bacterium]|nr:ABC transporter ATP-binding protein [Planctomycetota bacterium]